MVTHVFPKSQFTEDFVFFINNNFERKDHQFILYTNDYFELSSSIYQIENVYDLDSKKVSWLYHKLKESDKIIFHNISVTLPILVMLYLSKGIMEKAVWLIWGGDLYCYRNKKSTIIAWIVEHMRVSIIKRVSCIATIAEGDYVLARQWYSVNVPNIRLDYCSEREIKILSALRENNSANNTIRILIGNSATKTNNHMQIFEALKENYQGDVELIVPLAYGDKEYADEIEQYGKGTFGDNFIPIRNFMNMEKYYSLLNSVDAAIFNNDRQQATGNILALLFLGKKVYMRENTTMWDEYYNIQGYRIFKIEEFIRDYCNKEMCLSIVDKEINYKISSSFYSVQKRVEEWENCFNMKL